MASRTAPRSTAMLAAMRVALLAVAMSPSCSILLGGDGGNPDAGITPDANSTEGACDNNWFVAGGGLSGAPDGVSAVAVDGCTTYVCGTFEGALELSDPALMFFGAADVFVARLSPMGAIDWIHSIGANGNDRCEAIAVEGETVVIGGHWSGTDFAGTGVASQDRDGFVAGYHAQTGARRFAEILSASGETRVGAVAFRAAGDILVGGRVGSAGPVYDNVQAFPESGVFALLIDGNGDLVRGRGFGGSMLDTDSVNDMVRDPGGGMVLAATISDTLAAEQCSAAPEGQGGVLFHLDANLACEWAIETDSSGEDSLDRVVEIRGDFIAIGSTPATLSIPGTNLIDEGGQGPSDGFFIAVSSNGVPTRVRIHGSASSQRTRFAAIAANADAGEVAILAEFSESWSIGGANLIGTDLSQDLAVLFVDLDNDVTVGRARVVGAGGGTESGGGIGYRRGDVIVGGAYDDAYNVDGTLLPQTVSPDLFAVPLSNTP